MADIAKTYMCYIKNLLWDVLDADSVLGGL